VREATKHRTGYVAIVGLPNVGKSTLLNAILKDKLSAVTPKPQTTRHKIYGIISEENSQVILIDTPGFLKPNYALQEVMLKNIHSAIREADVIVFLTEPKTPEEGEKKIIELLTKVNHPSILAINKVDRITPKEKLLPIIDTYSKFNIFKEIIPISALKHDGLELLYHEIINCLPFSPPLYPREQLTLQPERFFVGEVIREKIFHCFRKELPYSTAVVVEDFQEKGKKILIRATLYVERPSQKGILIGHNGQELKKIGQTAREEIENFLNHEVYLELWVKVNPAWKRKPQELRKLGYSL
jgi:GTP-binding protein Era